MPFRTRSAYVSRGRPNECHRPSLWLRHRRPTVRGGFATPHPCGTRCAAVNVDLLLTTVGISIGDEDHVRDVLCALGGDLTVVKVAMKPGKPLAAGRLGDAAFIGLPGNPLAAPPWLAPHRPLWQVRHPGRGRSAPDLARVPRIGWQSLRRRPMYCPRRFSAWAYVPSVAAMSHPVLPNVKSISARAVWAAGLHGGMRCRKAR